MKPSQPAEPASPPWQPTTRLAVGVLLLVLGIVFVYAIRSLMVPVILAVLLAYLLHPLVTRLSGGLRIPRALAVVILYLVLLVLIGGAATGLGFAATQQVAGLVSDLGQISREIPSLLEQISRSRIEVGPWEIDLSAVNLDPVVSWLVSSVRPVLSETGRMVASVAGATASAVGLFLAVLVLGYYMLIGFGTLDDAAISMAPTAYRLDVRRLLDETGLVWQAFLRGQVILGVVVGVLSGVVLGVLGVRFALVLGLIAGVLEFVPIFGPILAGLIAVVVALFQGTNPWALSPLGLGLAVLVAFTLIQQIENNVLVPRIIGHSLNLNPLFVLLGALAGGTLAGVLGILLAAPTLATLRLWLGYVYRKVVGLDTWPQPVIRPRVRGVRPAVWRRLWSRWRSRRTRTADGGKAGSGS